jgi:hypothetical protein
MPYSTPFFDQTSDGQYPYLPIAPVRLLARQIPYFRAPDRWTMIFRAQPCCTNFSLMCSLTQEEIASGKDRDRRRLRDPLYIRDIGSAKWRSTCREIVASRKQTHISDRSNWQ